MSMIRNSIVIGGLSYNDMDQGNKWVAAVKSPQTECWQDVVYLALDYFLTVLRGTYYYPHIYWSYILKCSHRQWIEVCSSRQTFLWGMFLPSVAVTVDPALTQHWSMQRRHLVMHSSQVVLTTATVYLTEPKPFISDHSNALSKLSHASLWEG